MAIPALDIVTKRLEPWVLPSPHSRIVDLQADPRGGYWALVDVPRFAHDAKPAFLLQFDDTHSLLAVHAFSLTSPTNAGYDGVNVAAMSMGSRGIYVVGTASARHQGGLPSKVFVARFSIDGIYQGVTVYDPILLDGCEVPGAVQCTGIGIARLAPPEEDRLMVLFQTAAKFNGDGLPRADDAIGAGIFLIDDDGNLRSNGVKRIFGQGQLMPSRLRFLPNLGLAIVGRTRLSQTSGGWWGFFARVDSAANVIAEASYAIDNIPDVVLNDVVEGDYSIMTVGTAQQPDTALRAVTMRIEADGSVDWIGLYVPPRVGPELFGTQLNAVMAFDGSFVAAGAHSTQGITQPWLLQLTDASPDPVWQKEYSFATFSVHPPTTFNALLLNVPNRAVAGGDTPDYAAGPAVVERVPFLAVSETSPATKAPACSAETFAVALRTGVTALPPTPWMDRIPLAATQWQPQSIERQVGVDKLCYPG